MLNISRELLDHKYRELKVSFEDLFPKLDRKVVEKRFARLWQADPHATVFAAARELWEGGYESLLSEYGFFDKKDLVFEGHCHQATPALGLVLKVLGFEKLAYLECFRIRDHFPETGIIEKVPPEEEPDSVMRPEFCGIRRIPYCCLEVFVDSKPYYVSGKHVRPQGTVTNALLSPVCYEDFVGVLAHQEDGRKSGMYLQSVVPKRNPGGIDFSRRVVWMKQTRKDPAPEYFATFLRMELQ